MKDSLSEGLNNGALKKAFPLFGKSRRSSSGKRWIRSDLFLLSEEDAECLVAQTPFPNIDWRMQYL
jgi:hypothetical protein